MISMMMDNYYNVCDVNDGDVFDFMMTMIMMDVCSTRVSNELGAGNPERARSSVYVALMIAGLEGTVLSLGLFGLRRSWGYAYSNVDEVVHYALKMAPLVSLSILADALQGVISGNVQ